MRTDISIAIFAIYSLVLATSSSLHVSFVLPLLVELYRNKNDIFSILKRAVLLNIFLIFIAISVYISNPKLAILIFLRSNFILIFGLLLFNKKSYFHVSFGLKSLKVPDIFVSIFYFTSKFITMLKDDIKVFKQNLLTRGFVPRSNLFTYKTYANFVGLLFVNSFYKANNLSNILITRGFDGKIHSIQEENHISIYEISLILITIISLTLGFLT